MHRKKHRAMPHPAQEIQVAAAARFRAKGKNDAAWHRKKAIEQTFYGLLVRVVIQNFSKTIVVQFVF